MKKFIIILFCCLTLHNTSLVAQINDENWEVVFDEDFSINRWWDTITFLEQSSDPSFQQRWDCMSEEWWPYLVTTGSKSHQAYQPSHARFGNDHKLRLVAECKSTTTPLKCEDGDYIIPQNAHCSLDNHPPHNSIFYYSGTIETSAYNCWYGYYEVKCQLPSHLGEGSAVWLFGNGDSTTVNRRYEEIDIFEHSQYDAGEYGHGNMDTICSYGIWKNLFGSNYSPNNYNSGAKKLHKGYMYTPSDNNFTQEHIFGLKWHPDSVIWYLDGRMVDYCTDRNIIPQQHLRLKVTHSVKHEAYDTIIGKPKWIGSDEMVVDYIRYYRLKTDCETDLVIEDLNDWSQCVGVKKSITIDPNTDFIVPNNSNKCLRAAEHITITSNSNFTIPLGAQVTITPHECFSYEE